MGLFSRKKKRMIDIRELQKRGRMRVRLPIARGESTGDVVTNDEGFVEMVGNGVGGGVGSEAMVENLSKPKTSSGGGDFFGFMDNPALSISSSADSSDSLSTLSSKTTPSEDLRKISAQIAELDNKLYKMEQRIELLERKSEIGGL